MGSFFGVNRVFDSARCDFWVCLVIFFSGRHRREGDCPSEATWLSVVCDASWHARGGAECLP